MDIPGIVALFTCFTLIIIKMFFSLRAWVLRRIQSVENEHLKNARKDLHAAEQRHKHLETEHKRLESQWKSISSGIERTKKELEGLRRRKSLKESFNDNQEALAERLRKQVFK